MSAKKRIGTAESQLFIVEGVKAILENQPDFEFCGNGHDSKTLTQLVTTQNLDVLILSRRCGHRQILEWITAMNAKKKLPKLIVWGNSFNIHDTMHLLQMGVVGILRETAE